MNKKFHIKYKYSHHKAEYYFFDTAVAHYNEYKFNKLSADLKVDKEIKFDKIHNIGCKYIIEKYNE